VSLGLDYTSRALLVGHKATARQPTRVRSGKFASSPTPRHYASYGSGVCRGLGVGLVSAGSAVVCL
jgi:hypothetical protein